MKRNELLSTIRPGKRHKAVEMAMRPNGVTSSEMVIELGAPLLNGLRALHVQGLATLMQLRAANGIAYCLVTDESLNAQALRAQQLRREAYKRMQAEPNVDDADDEQW